MGPGAAGVPGERVPGRCPEPAGLADSSPVRADPCRVRPRDGLQRRPLGGDGQRAAGDPAIRERYEFWAFSYDSGNPIVYSSMILRDSLTDAVHRLDPEGTDPGLKQMVVIGHSQGGLLTKMTVVSTGSKLYEAVFAKPIDQLNVSEETRDIVRRVMFVEPLPFVKQVVFISTPHRGSFLAANEFVTDPAPPDRQHAGAPGEGHRRAAAEWRGRPRDPGGKSHADRGGQHVAAAPVHQDALDHPDRPRGGGVLHHRREGQRPDRDGRRWRRQVRERAHRRREVGAGGPMGALGPGPARRPSWRSGGSSSRARSEISGAKRGPSTAHHPDRR